MQSLWNDNDASQFTTPRALRVYSSRLLGSDSNLVLHGGGNTSVKETVTDLFGNPQQILTVKGSGWDLATIEEAGFAPVLMEPLLKMAELDQLSDRDMVKAQKAAMIDTSAPGPSIEAILHAIIPFTFVDHSHADAIVTITNTPEGEDRIRQALGENILVVPYVMPGFILAKTIHQMTRDTDWSTLEGIVLMNHGLFTFHDEAKQSYEKHIELVSRAEDYLAANNALPAPAPEAQSIDPLDLAKIRRQVSQLKQRPTLARFNQSDLARSFAALDLSQVPNPGPLTPEHVIRTKSFGVVLTDKAQHPAELESFVTAYGGYFEQHNQGETCLNPAPNYGVWKDRGAIAFGNNSKELGIIEDLNQHTFEAILRAESLGGYQALGPTDLFEIEYWELEQAKLKKAGAPPALSGKIILLADQDSDYRQTLATQLQKLGATVVAIDPSQTDSADAALRDLVLDFGGLDGLLLSAGSQALLTAALPFLQEGIDPVIVGHQIQTDLSVDKSAIRINYINRENTINRENASNSENKTSEDSLASLTVELFRQPLSGARISC